jgi:hypothetical protein
MPIGSEGAVRCGAVRSGSTVRWWAATVQPPTGGGGSSGLHARGSDTLTRTSRRVPHGREQPRVRPCPPIDC